MWGCFLMSGVKILHFLKDWWKSIPIHQNYTMALRWQYDRVSVSWQCSMVQIDVHCREKQKDKHQIGQFYIHLVSVSGRVFHCILCNIWIQWYFHGVKKKEANLLCSTTSLIKKTVVLLQSGYYLKVVIDNKLAPFVVLIVSLFILFRKYNKGCKRHVQPHEYLLNNVGIIQC